MRTPPLRPYAARFNAAPAAAQSATPMTDAAPAAAQAPRFLNNNEAAAYLRLSPRTLEKQRVVGGGPRFRKFGRRVMYAVTDLNAWADRSAYDATSDLEYAERHGAESRHGR